MSLEISRSERIFSMLCSPTLHTHWTLCLCYFWKEETHCAAGNVKHNAALLCIRRQENNQLWVRNRTKFGVASCKPKGPEVTSKKTPSRLIADLISDALRLPCNRFNILIFTSKSFTETCWSSRRLAMTTASLSINSTWLGSASSPWYQLGKGNTELLLPGYSFAN